ncbi:MAG: hypothetical protein KBE91_10490 [Bacteroidia bacterium]|nr:hypothetical protein [Bacteroidia bacterium]MBP9690029.1 hypothetical protein [Bacteroidia bacterium]
MKLFMPLFCAVALFFSTTAVAQDTLIFKSNLGAGLIVDRVGNKLNFKYLIKSSQDIPSAKRYFRKARFNNVIATIFFLPGAAIASYPLGVSLSGAKINTDLLMLGGGLILVSVPFHIFRNKNMRRGVEAYNREVYRGE